MALALEEQLDWLVANGFADDLRKVILGQSEYSDMRDYEQLDRFSHRLRGMALQHLEFVAEFGFESIGSDIKRGKHIFSAFPDYFLAWKLAGAPGVTSVMIDKLYQAKSGDAVM